MNINDRPRESLIAGYCDAPTTHNLALHNRAPHPRRIRVVAVAAAVALTLVGCQRATDLEVSSTPPAAVPSPDESETLPWLSAMVSRNGATVTVYSGPGDLKCKELSQPQGTLVEQEDRVVVAVKGRVVAAADCATSGFAIPVVVSLRKPLGDRVLRDAAGDLPRATYFERDLPDLRLDKRWSPYSVLWTSTDEGWYQGYNGPGGSGLRLRAEMDRSLPDPVATISIGSRKGVITQGVGGSWTVWWEVGDVTYSLWLIPNEGGTFTLAQFKRELAKLKWA